MPKRADIKSILIIGAGPIVIGQACEFDYAGTQACKALREEGYRIILVNSNPATIMTDPDIADSTYIEPITVKSLEYIIAKERPQALLPTLGGQTALNCSLDLAKAGILADYGVELIGASVKAIELAEDRFLFQDLMKSIGLQVPNAVKVQNMAQAMVALESIHLPVMIRPSFILGGFGAGIAATLEEFTQLCQRAFAVSPRQEILIDEALIGWKEFELEVIRDKKDNCIIVCGVENIDPLSIHTGDSITVSPIQTLTDKEYQAMRQAAFAVLQAVGVDTGGSNVQFAVHPETGRMVVIEMNPRVSRSSALVSKASGFPIAKIAAKLAIGYTLDELRNEITGDRLPASFEPSLDYVVVKIPRFNLEKFPETHPIRGPQMQSVGEAMAIGRTFPEALQKAMRSLEIDQDGFGDLYASYDDLALKKALLEAGPTQLWTIGEALRRQMSITEIKQLTHIDPWFLENINAIIQAENNLLNDNIDKITPELLHAYKKIGFSDSRLATLLRYSEQDITGLRKQWQINPVYKRIDSCAGEFATTTAYLYSTYEQYCEAEPSTCPKMLIIGSGPNRIGQGIEFDYCCVQAIKTLHAKGYETIMINCNPETVSTDYDIVDRLYCAPLTLEDVLEIIALEKPIGVFVQFGGQTPLHLATGLAAAQVPLLGVDISAIQITEDRQKFQQLVTALNLKQPKNLCIHSSSKDLQALNQLQFPLIVRPSFVLGGRAMSIVNDQNQLHDCLMEAFSVNNTHPVLIEEFLQNAIEVDVEAIADGTDVFIPGLLEHIESAGVHSGDSACITPPAHLTLAIQLAIKQEVLQIAKYLNLRGVFNVQFAVQNDDIYILEVNPRASRTLPFLSKATGLPLVEIATRCVLGESLASQGIKLTPELPYFYVKEAVLPFAKFPNTSALLGPEMKSTGEVMGIGTTSEEAYAKAQIAAGNHLPKPGIVWLIAPDSMTRELSPLVEKLTNLGFTIHCYSDAKIPEFNSASEKNITLDKNHYFTKFPNPCVLVIALTNVAKPSEFVLQAVRFAIDHNICYATSLPATHMLVDALEPFLTKDYSAIPLQNLYQQIKHSHLIKHLLTGEELTAEQITKLLNKAISLKQKRLQNFSGTELKGYHLALLFDKPSLRTRCSFTVAMRELGGEVIESIESTRKPEQPADQAQVLNGYCQAIMIRTHQDSILEKMREVAKVPIINGLSDFHHPCQIFADLLTLLEIFGSLKGLTLSYIGDGNNILHSLLLLAPQLDINIHYCCPPTREPDAKILARSLARTNQQTGQIQAFSSPETAVVNAHAIYTDVWTSMGFEESSADHLFDGFQVNEKLMQKALPQTIFMHCLPMNRGQEVSETLPDLPCSVIFRQSENRLHVQKALLLYLLKGEL